MTKLTDEERRKGRRQAQAAREEVEHKIAKEAADRERSDPFVYNRVRSRLRNGTHHE